MQNRSLELDKIISKLYEDAVLQKISEERYSALAEKFENEQKEISEKIEAYQKKITSENLTLNSIDSFLQTIKKYDDVTELNQYVLLDLIEKIVIRQRQNDEDYEDVIDIYFKSIGNIFFED